MVRVAVAAFALVVSVEGLCRPEECNDCSVAVCADVHGCFVDTSRNEPFCLRLAGFVDTSHTPRLQNPLEACAGDGGIQGALAAGVFGGFMVGVFFACYNFDKQLEDHIDELHEGGEGSMEGEAIVTGITLEWVQQGSGQSGSWVQQRFAVLEFNNTEYHVTSKVPAARLDISQGMMPVPTGELQEGQRVLVTFRDDDPKGFWLSEELGQHYDRRHQAPGCGQFCIYGFMGFFMIMGFGIASACQFWGLNYLVFGCVCCGMGRFAKAGGCHGGGGLHRGKTTIGPLGSDYESASEEGGVFAWLR